MAGGRFLRVLFNYLLSSTFLFQMTISLYWTISSLILFRFFYPLLFPDILFISIARKCWSNALKMSVLFFMVHLPTQIDNMLSARVLSSPILILVVLIFTDILSLYYIIYMTFLVRCCSSQFAIFHPDDSLIINPICSMRGLYCRW